MPTPKNLTKKQRERADRARKAHEELLRRRRWQLYPKRRTW